MNAQDPTKLRERVEAALADAAKILPSQNPLVNFIHHNPLHSFEHIEFREAVEQASEIAGARAWCTAEYYRDAYRDGRILNRDIADVLRREVEDEEIPLPGLRLKQRDAMRLVMLAPETGVHQPEASAWILREKLYSASLPEGLDRESEERLRIAGAPADVLKALWAACDKVAIETRQPKPSARLATIIAEHLDADLDAMVEPTIVRWASAYIDVGQAAWAMPDREDGYFRCVLRVLDAWGTRLRPGGKWLLSETRRLRSSGADAMASVCESLVDIGVPPEEVGPFLVDTLMQMPGFAGMFERLHRRPDLAPTTTVPPTKLVDFLAVRLLLERATARHLIRQHRSLLTSQPLLEAIRECRTIHVDPHDDYRRVAPFFHTALALGIAPTSLRDASPLELDAFRELTADCAGNRLRWLWHLAYERRYRMQVLDALTLHKDHVVEPPEPHTQVLMCIDDREESIRRHLEEVDPRYATLGYAGFYNVAIRFQGLGERDSRALCPGARSPTHAMLERAITDSATGSVAQPLEPTGANSGLLRSALENMLGWLALFPMAWRLVSPERSAQRRRGKARPATTLTLLRDPKKEETAFGLPLGYTEDEMAEVVGLALRQMGFVDGFARLVVVLGHGSHNVNNPHAAGYNCGACAGGNGGPNARAFAAMCNREAVRDRLRIAGIDIPSTTRFVGGVHETAGDIVDLFDTDEVPTSHASDIARLKKDLLEASRRDAHERCRRFESAPLDITEEEALRHVIGRSEDLAQARPEYNHVTNALCIVARRTVTRGLFLDRRAFLVSYDPDIDEDGSSLASLLASMGPVGAGINLEYFFSFVDNDRYGAGTKLPHNVVGLVSVMNGSASDLRTGLVEQMIEIHEPMRLLLIVEATPEQANAAVQKDEALVNLVTNRWLLVATVDPQDGAVHFLEKEGFEQHVVEDAALPSVGASREIYTGSRACLRPVRVSTLTRELSL